MTVEVEPDNPSVPLTPSSGLKTIVINLNELPAGSVKVGELFLMILTSLLEGNETFVASKVGV